MTTLILTSIAIKENQMRLYRAANGSVIEEKDRWYLLADGSWDDLLNEADLAMYLRQVISDGSAPECAGAMPSSAWLAPIGSQEVWAAGVTYHRSRDARMEESRQAGADDFYARVYDAARPELFLKATPHRVVGPGQPVRIRSDSEWNVPEPELALAVNRTGRIIGYTIGNDMSSRDIEGENPLYLPQAKVYNECCALGPGILVAEQPLPLMTTIHIEIRRRNDPVFAGETTLERLKRTPDELVEYLFRDNSFPFGAFLLTGTGIVPPATFTLRPGDQVSIAIDEIGVLSNPVIQG